MSEPIFVPGTCWHCGKSLIVSPPSAPPADDLVTRLQKHERTEWLIELRRSLSAPAEWLCGYGRNDLDWAATADRAIRFSRKQDAEAIINRFRLDFPGRESGDKIIATEHIFETSVTTEAADEITQLREQVANAHGVAQACERRAEQAEQQVERLQKIVAAADAMRDWFHHVTVRAYDAARAAERGEYERAMLITFDTVDNARAATRVIPPPKAWQDDSATGAPK